MDVLFFERKIEKVFLFKCKILIKLDFILEWIYYVVKNKKFVYG